MRFCILSLALVICGTAITVEALPHAPQSLVCKYGLCSFDQMYQAASAGDLSASDVSGLLQQDPNNPNAWCTYADFLALRGQSTEAIDAFERALELAPGVPAVAMRAANFDFTHNRRAQAFQLTSKILSETDSFDDILFSYLKMSGASVDELAGDAIPVTPRAAHSWLLWMISQEAPRAELLAAWDWMHVHKLASAESAPALVNELWKRRDFEPANAVWKQSQETGSAEILSNAKFQRQPRLVPLDWNLAPMNSVEYLRDSEGLDVHFLGQDNLEFRGVYQFAALTPGKYRLSAEVSSADLTTDQRPFLEVEDGEVPNRFDAKTESFAANSSRSTVTVDVNVPRQTRIVIVRLVRLPSWKFDNKIAGHLRIHSVTLSPL